MTPIEKLIEELQVEHDFINDDKSYQSGLKNAIIALTSALPAEREAIEKAFSDGQQDVWGKIIKSSNNTIKHGLTIKSAQQYFNETFKPQSHD